MHPVSRLLVVDVRYGCFRLRLVYLSVLSIANIRLVHSIILSFLSLDTRPISHLTGPYEHLTRAPSTSHHLTDPYLYSPFQVVVALAAGSDAHRSRLGEAGVCEGVIACLATHATSARAAAAGWFLDAQQYMHGRFSQYFHIYSI